MRVAHILSTSSGNGGVSPYHVTMLTLIKKKINTKNKNYPLLQYNNKEKTESKKRILITDR